ncbi:MAG: hypothetical protein ABI740_04735 [Alphaproteobacteria bacterium]
MRMISLIAVALAATLAACSEKSRVVEAGERFGCAPVEGVAQLSGPKAARYTLVGEFTETNEAPAAFAEIACHAAASLKPGQKLFVGVSEYLGGATDAETRMRKRLDALAASGVPVIVGVIGEQGREWTPKTRDLSEAHWAEAIEAKVTASAASRALILLPRADASTEPVKGGERYAGYDPMPMHLSDGQVMSFEIARAATVGPNPAIRIYPRKADGFSGEVAFARLTRPGVAVVLPDPPTPRRAAEPPIGGDRVQSIFIPTQPGEPELPMPPPMIVLPEFTFEGQPPPIEGIK